MAALPIYGQAQAATGTDPQSPQHQRIFRGSVGLSNFNSIASVACSTSLAAAVRAMSALRSGVICVTALFLHGFPAQQRRA